METDLHFFKEEKIQLIQEDIIYLLLSKLRKDTVWKDLILGIIVNSLISQIISIYRKKHQGLPSTRRINIKLKVLKLIVWDQKLHIRKIVCFVSLYRFFV